MVFVMEKEYFLCEVGESFVCNSDKCPSKSQRSTFEFLLTLKGSECG